ncbi:MAG: hypothetical protein ACYCVH_01475 [Ignavibacteriaceae bacterium]
MKKINILLTMIAIFLFLSCQIFAQQDYKTVENYKAKHKQIEEAIKSAGTLTDLDQVKTQIDQLSGDYMPHKELLDKSLYPDDFNSSIAKLNNELTLRQDDFGQISTLQTQVSRLQTQIDTLNQKNADLINQLQQMQTQNKKDVARLDRIISELRYSLLKRDRLIMNMVDSLMPSSNLGSSTLTNSEQQRIYSETKKMDLISNIKKSIDDNIKFLNAAALTPNDLNSIKTQQHDFEKMWHNAGPQISNIYSRRHEDVKNLKDIDSALTSWDNAIVQQTWNSISQSFAMHGIILDKFSSGDEFTQAVSSYIDVAIKNISVSGEDAKTTYRIFADTVWSGIVKPVWLPYLANNNMLTNTDRVSIEAKIAQWKNVAFPSSFFWLYILVGIVIIVVIVLLVRSKSSIKHNIDVEGET